MFEKRICPGEIIHVHAVYARLIVGIRIIKEFMNLLDNTILNRPLRSDAESDGLVLAGMLFLIFVITRLDLLLARLLLGFLKCFDCSHLSLTLSLRG